MYPSHCSTHLQEHTINYDPYITLLYTIALLHTKKEAHLPQQQLSCTAVMGQRLLVSLRRDRELAH